MTRARRAREPGAGAGAGGCIAMVEWAARLGAISAVALAEHESSGVVSARAKLAAAERDGLLRRAMAHATVLASFNVEEFGTSRLERLSGAEIVARLGELRAMTGFAASDTPLRV